MDTERKVFDDFPQVSCNDCEHWWLNQCDGTEKDEHKVCHSFLATRHIVIPEKLKRLERKIDGLSISIILVSAAMLIHIIFG